MINDGEEILWTGKPKLIPYAMNGFGLGVGAFTIIVGMYALGNIARKDSAMPPSFYWFPALLLAISIWHSLLRIFTCRRTHYFFTSERIIIREGLSDKNTKSIALNKISEITTSSNLIELAFNVRTIKFYSGRSYTSEGITMKLYDRFEAIANHQAVFRELKIRVPQKPTFRNTLRQNDKMGNEESKHS